MSKPCTYETPESFYGARDGGFQCPSHADMCCDGCGDPFCAAHINVCPDCGKCFCNAPREARCWSAHAHDPVRMGPVSEQCFEAVDRVMGTT